jgi:hypothetical protein
VNRIVAFFNKPMLVAIVVFLVLWSIARRFI